MRICGKALPPRAALLLSFDFVVLVLLAPLVFMIPVLAEQGNRPTSSLFFSLLRLMLVGLAAQVIFYYSELYNLQIIRLPRATVTQVLKAFAVLFALLAFTCVALPTLAPVLSRVVLFAGMLATITVVSRKWALPRVRERVLIIGRGDEAADLQQLILSSPEWNMEVAEIASLSESDGTAKAQSFQTGSFDRVIVTNAQKQISANLETLLTWKMQGQSIEDAQAFFERATGRVRIDHLTADQCIFSDRYSNRVGKRVLKRVFDVVAAGILLTITLPLMVVVAAIIWMQRDGDVFFRQQRIGLFGKPFSIYKFRSMSPVKPEQSTGWAGKETNRITPLGKRLRKYRIDELPQLVNVLRGEMSLIGPRPEQPHLCDLLQSHIPFYKHRHSVPPGLTGWAQVRYHYGSSIEESKRKLEYDLFYVKHLSLWLDFAIVLETVKVVLVGRGAL